MEARESERGTADGVRTRVGRAMVLLGEETEKERMGLGLGLNGYRNIYPPRIPTSGICGYRPDAPNFRLSNPKPSLSLLNPKTCLSLIQNKVYSFFLIQMPIVALLFSKYLAYNFCLLEIDLVRQSRFVDLRGSHTTCD